MLILQRLTIANSAFKKISSCILGVLLARGAKRVILLDPCTVE